MSCDAATDKARQQFAVNGPSPAGPLAAAPIGHARAQSDATIVGKEAHRRMRMSRSAVPASIPGAW